MMSTTQHPPHLVDRVVLLALEEALVARGPIHQR
jgi:hypothetical protein